MDFSCFYSIFHSWPRLYSKDAHDLSSLSHFKHKSLYISKVLESRLLLSSYFILLYNYVLGLEKIISKKKNTAYNF